MRFPRLRFGLRTLLVLTVLVAIPSAWLGKHWLRTRIERPIVAKIRANGGHVYYDYHRDGNNFVTRKTPPGWKPLRAMFGDDIFAAVIVAHYGLKPPPQIIDIEFDQLTELEQLYLNCQSVPESTIEKLSSLQKLESLQLQEPNFPPEVLRKLADCKALIDLSIFGGNLSSETLRELKTIPQLTAFHWSSATLTDEGLLAICELRNLEFLDLRWTSTTPQLTTRGFAGLAQLKKLQILNLNGPADDGIAAIANAPDLKSVMLWSDQLTDAGMLKMATLPKLAHLKIDSNQITDAGFAAIANMTNLEHLQLDSPNITDAGLKNFRGLTKLQMVMLSSSRITDAGLPALLNLTQLAVLELQDAALTDQGLQQLAELRKLKSLTITLGPNLTIDGVNQLRTKLPDCKFFDSQQGSPPISLNP